MSIRDLPTSGLELWLPCPSGVFTVEVAARDSTSLSSMLFNHWHHKLWYIISPEFDELWYICSPSSGLLLWKLLVQGASFFHGPRIHTWRPKQFYHLSSTEAHFTSTYIMFFLKRGWPCTDLSDPMLLAPMFFIQLLLPFKQSGFILRFINICSIWCSF